MSASKIYAVPGIRLGLVSSSTNTISNIRNHITPFSVGNLQIHTLEHLVTNEYAYLKYSQKQNSDNVNRIYKTFNQLGIKYIPTSANFVFIEDKAMKIANNFEKVGVKVRNGIDFGVDYQEFLRIKLWNQDLDNIIINVLKK
jgi:histidinol-phosphate aminotransferase